MRMEDRHQGREEHVDDHSQAHPEALFSNAVRRANLMGRYNTLSGVDIKRLTWSNRMDQVERKLSKDWKCWVLSCTGSVALHQKRCPAL
jgi:hypothetical protein